MKSNTSCGVFRRFGSEEVHFEEDKGVLELFETDAADVDMAADAFTPLVRAERVSGFVFLL